MINTFKYLLLILFSSISFATTIHVATTGSDDTGDGTEGNPFSTIEMGIDYASDGDSVMVESGEYLDSGDFFLNKSSVYIIGENRATTFWNSNSEIISFRSQNFEPDSVKIEGLSSLSYFRFENVNHIEFKNVSINIDDYNIQLHNTNNLLVPYFSNVIAEECLFSGEILAYGLDDGSSLEFNYCTFTKFEFTGPSFISEGVDSLVNINNSILQGYPETFVFNEDYFEFNYCYFLFDLDVTGVENIFDSNVFFCDPDNGDFSLAENSPAIGAGENGTDIGAFGVGCEPIELSIDESVMPIQHTLHQNYPNPFNPTTKISYDLPEASVVSLSIYDLMGREIRTMINSEQKAGFKNIQWNATDNLGKSVPAGMYIYTIQAGEFRQTRKMVLLK